MIQFGTKAETLEAIRPRLTKSKVCPSVIFTVADWTVSADVVLKKIQAAFPAGKLIVRSSAISEDSAVTAMAGLHDSVPNISATSSDELKRAIEQVIGSYREKGNGEARNQVLVQPMVTDVSMSGVVFTQDLNTGGPYYVINYDDETGLTDTITSGTGDTNRTLLVHRGQKDKVTSSRFKTLLDAVLELETLFPGSPLDIEFAVTHSQEIYVFQVRRITVGGNWSDAVTRRVDTAAQQISAFLESRFCPVDGAVGQKSLFGEMSDWNPAEMIGAVPRQLALTLYQFLITDTIWAEARAEMGYRDLSGRSLMFSLGGRPYIDVRESFNSFLPAGLGEPVATKLVNLWLTKLEAAPELHDKIEFDVATTVHSLDFASLVKPVLEGAVLTKAEAAEYERALLAMTNNIISGRPDVIETQHEMTRKLEERRNQIMAFASSGKNKLALAKSLLVDCRRLGTKPFAILARCGFITEEFLRSMVRTGLLSQSAAADFRGSVKTVLSNFLEDVQGYQAGKITAKQLFDAYGHLRPGTYNILSQRYDQRSDFLAGGRGAKTPAGAARTRHEFTLSADTKKTIDAYLAKHGFAFDCERLFHFMREAIAGREHAKFKFTQNLSDALELLAKWGESFGLSREDLSHISVRDMLRVETEIPTVPLADHFRELARRAADAHAVSHAVKLPYLIADLTDVHVVPLLKSRPNFITQKSVQSEVIFLSGQSVKPDELKGKVVLIEGADPGYDWIFMTSIAGLITKYGGANSHMAIRCAELAIPAAIGCGEQIFERALAANELCLDCGAGQIFPTG